MGPGMVASSRLAVSDVPALLVLLLVRDTRLDVDAEGEK